MQYQVFIINTCGNVITVTMGQQSDKYDWRVENNTF